jgi:hypothetical protein
MWKRLLPFVLLGAAMLLTGCITLEIQNVINPDGTGEKVMITAMDQETYDMLMSSTPSEGTEVQDPFADTWDKCEEVPEATCEEYVDEEAELTGVRVSVPFDSLDELVELSGNAIFNDSDEISFEQAGDSTTMHIVVRTRDVGSEVAGSSGEMKETPEPQATLTPEQQQQMEQLLEMMDIKFYYRVTAPALVTDYGPQEDAEYDEETNTVTWAISLMSEGATREFWLTWGGGPVAAEPTAVPTAKPTARPTAEPTARPTAEPAGGEPSQPTPAPSGGATPRPCSCLPSLTLPALGLGMVFFLHRRRRI